MSYIWTVVLFDGYDWRPYGGEDFEFVTEAGARSAVAMLSKAHPNLSFRSQKAGRAFLNRL